MLSGACGLYRLGLHYVPSLTMRLPVNARGFGFLLVVAAVCLRMAGDAAADAVPGRLAFAAAMPATVLWAWEEPEDLRGVDPHTIGVAYLAETVLLGDAPGLRTWRAAIGAGANVDGPDEITIRRRHSPLAVAPGTAMMAVVRIETQPGFRDSEELRLETASALAEVSRRPGTRALQVDFDATRSERAFYGRVLRALRAQMPAGMPLAITALASWCAAGPGDLADWMAGLPVDEAVPMFFRLGGRAKPYDDKSWLTVREPLCRGSVGISTDESWPEMGWTPPVGAGRRVYMFSPTPWEPEQLVAAASVGSGERPAVLRVRDGLAGVRVAANDTGLRPRGETLSGLEEEQP